MDTDYLIDENGLLALKLTPSADGHSIHAHLYSKYTENSKLVHNILPLLSFEAGENATKPEAADFDIKIADKNIPVTLKINNHEFASFAVTGDEVKASSTRKLCVFETRMIGRAPQKTIPLAAMDLHDSPMPITDLHTHLGGQVSAKDLIALGLKHNISYPAGILDDLGIKYDPKKGEEEKSDTVIPLRSLSEHALESLQKALSHTPESQDIFADMKQYYFMRDPFTKNIHLFKDILEKIAEAYEKQGIKYAEISANTVGDPKWLKIIHDTLPAIEEKTGVKLRFMVGISRTLDEEALYARVEQIKRIASSPYVVGVDVFGHEINKTSHLKGPLENLAGWMRDNNSNMILQIHAGENSKNQENVKEALRLAKTFNIRMRIIHAIHGLDEEAFRLASEIAQNKKIQFAFCPDSNFVLNNIDFPHEVRPSEFIRRKIPTVLASDGADLYRTSAKQTAVAGALCGVSSEGFKFIHQTELNHIAQQDEIFHKKQTALDPNFFASLKIPAVPKKPAVAPPAIPQNNNTVLQYFLNSKKRSLFIGGAAGTSWDMIKKLDQREVQFGLKRLLEQLDPEKVFFVTGRTKERGVGVILGEAITNYNATHEKKFDCLLMEAEKQSDKVTEGITHKYFIDSSRGSAPSAIMKFIKNTNGFSLFMGGSYFTSDFIQKASLKEIPFGLMDFSHSYGAKDTLLDASTKKTKVFPDNRFIGASEMVRYTLRQAPDIFKGDIGLGGGADERIKGGSGFGKTGKYR